MIIDLRVKILLAVLLIPCFMLTGCKDATVAEEEYEPCLVGDWGAPDNGLRCRVLLLAKPSEKATPEDKVRIGIDIQNVSESPFEVVVGPFPKDSGVRSCIFSYKGGRWPWWPLTVFLDEGPNWERFAWLKPQEIARRVLVVKPSISEAPQRLVRGGFLKVKIFGGDPGCWAGKCVSGELMIDRSIP